MANLYNKAGLVNIPIGYSDGFLYNIKPVDDTLAFRFDRASSATRVNEQGLIKTVATDEPRIDYTDSLTSPSFLLEPQSTNLIPYSEGYSQWGTVNGAVVTDNFTTSPDGTQNAAKVVYDGTSLGRIEINTGASGTNTQSIYLKTVSGTQVVSIGASSSDLTEVTVTNEWKRFTHTGSGSYPRVLCNDAATIYAWGAHLEQGSYATSYIPTGGSTATRIAETCNGAGSASTFNDSEGVLYAEVKRFDNDTGFGAISIGDGTGNNQVVFKFRNTTNIVWAIIKSGGVNQAVMQYTASDLTVFNKLAIKYKANDFALWFNGVQVLTDTSGIVATGLNTLALQDDNGSEQFRGNVKCVAVFKEALTDAELQQLTS